MPRFTVPELTSIAALAAVALNQSKKLLLLITMPLFAVPGSVLDEPVNVICFVAILVPAGPILLLESNCLT